MRIDETIGAVETNGDLIYMPELLRVRGCLLSSIPDAAPNAAEISLQRSLDLSRHLATPAWELRAATNLAAIWACQDQADHARALLRPIFDRFTEGSTTADLKAAERLLSTLP